MINKHIFRAYDIRGLYPEDLNIETAYLIGKGTGSYLKRKYNTKNMAVGRDVRLSGESLQEAFIKGVTESGIDVIKVGLAPSPMIYWAACAMDFDSATNITASHNPKQYNGFKTVTKGAHSICGDELQAVLKLIETEDFETSHPTGKISEQNIWQEYKQDLLTKATLSRPLKVVIDAGNGVAGPFAPELLREFGCEVIELYCDPDGNFPNHEANPEERHNMEDLINKVTQEKADLGIGFDGDADRIGIVDETGHMYSSDFMLLLLVRDLLERQKSPQIVFDVKVSQVIINDMKARGAIPVMSKTGHSFIEAKMKELNAPLGGEVSGHLFFGENYYGFDDALLAALKILSIVSKSETPLSLTFGDLPQVHTTPEYKAPCPDDKKFAIVESLVAHFTQNYDCITIDGVRINFDENSWGAIRASNTSPNLTLRFEAPTIERLKEIETIMATEIKKYPEASLGWYQQLSSLLQRNNS
ncbi:phosphomannomutase [Candidatus Peregrinibacteria bacterium CG10_big_fil_rev_8_21_14_0_10_36_19]|nr:MAG: phosphomannomutase [Candidatus Peregrinibacteria bacterium CG10_big_fil_rev_8_21_14_0_10_36_19]